MDNVTVSLPLQEFEEMRQKAKSYDAKVAEAIHQLRYLKDHLQVRESHLPTLPGIAVVGSGVNAITVSSWATNLLGTLEK